MPLRGSRLLLWVTIPYLLLSGSQSAKLKTEVFLNGSCRRSLEALVYPDRQEEIGKLVRGPVASAWPQPLRLVSSQGSMEVRSQRVYADLDELNQQCAMQVKDIFEQPFNVFSYYTWTEQIFVDPKDATDVEKAGWAQAHLTYELTLPGHVMTETVSPAVATVDGGKVTWKLPASPGLQVVQATSRVFRWDYIIMALYILAFIAYNVMVYVGRLLRFRPRRI